MAFSGETELYTKFSVAFSGDCTMVARGDDRIVRVYAASSGEQLLELGKEKDLGVYVSHMLSF